MLSKTRRNRILYRYNYHCAYCGQIMGSWNNPKRRAEIDHIISKSRGGNNDDSNLNPACHECNYYKASLSLEEFRNWLLSNDVTTHMYRLYNRDTWKGLFYFERHQCFQTAAQ